MKAIWELFAFWTTMSRKRNRIIDEGKADRSVYFAVQSICFSVVGCALLALCVWGASALLLQNDGLDALVTVPLAIILAAVAVALLIRGPIAGLVALIYQLRLNRRAIGWVALAVWILSLAGGVVAVLLLLGNFGEAM